MLTKIYLDSRTEGIIASTHENVVPVRWYVKTIHKQDCTVLFCATNVI
ncbi:hypothetical protein [Acinetobacter baumannii]